MRRAASIPFSPGIRTSRIAASGSCSRASASASSPSRASAHTSNPFASSRPRRSMRTIGSSSAISTRGAPAEPNSRSPIGMPSSSTPSSSVGPTKKASGARKAPEAASPARPVDGTPTQRTGSNGRMTDVTRTDGEAPLRRDVRLLGDILGRVIVEQEGEELLHTEERIRALSRAGRAGSPPAELREAVQALDVEMQGKVLRAFATYFQLANLAEQHHRLRRRREYEHEERVPRESLEEAFARLEGV